MGATIHHTGDYRIRPMRPQEIARLAAVDRAADSLFLDSDVPEAVAMVDGPPASPADFRDMLETCHVMVACAGDDRAVGFAASQVLQSDLYLRLLAVDPGHTRRGLGSALVAQTAAHGRCVGAARCALSTFRQIPFNQPFYERLGFRELPLAAAPSALVARFEAEIPETARSEQRVLMVLEL